MAERVGRGSLLRARQDAAEQRSTIGLMGFVEPLGHRTSKRS